MMLRVQEAKIAFKNHRDIFLKMVIYHLNKPGSQSLSNINKLINGSIYPFTHPIRMRFPIWIAGWVSGVFIVSRIIWKSSTLTRSIP